MTTQDENNQSLDFNMNILTDNQSSAPSLESIYNINVFSNVSNEKFLEIKKEEQQKVSNIKSSVFQSKDNSDDAIDTIKSKVFSISTVSKEEIVETDENDNTMSGILISIILFCFIFITSLFYAKKKNRERKAYLENINSFNSD